MRHRECYWGDLIVQGQQANLQDCQYQSCAGNSGEACGGGNRILIYKDKLWMIPDRPTLGNDYVKPLAEALNKLRTAVQTWQSDVQAYLSYVQTNSQKARRDSSQRQQYFKPCQDSAEVVIKSKSMQQAQRTRKISLANRVTDEVSAAKVSYNREATAATNYGRV